MDISFVFHPTAPPEEKSGKGVPRTFTTGVLHEYFFEFVTTDPPSNDPNASQSQPDIHLFDLQSSSWSKAQLVQAPPGTFSDIPPNPSSPPPGNSGNPGNGGPSEGGSNTPDNPRIKDPSPPNATTSRSALIGGIVGGIVALGVLIFVGFFFSRRRGSKQKSQHQSELALQSWDGDDGLHKEPRMHDRERSSRGDETSLDAIDYQQKATLSESYQHKIASPQAQAKAQPRVNSPQVAYTPTISQHEIALPQAQAKAQPRVNNPQEAYTPTISQYEIALPQAGSPQETPQQQIVNFQEKAWSPASNYHKTASSPRDSPRKMSRSRVNNPQEVTRAMVPVVHRVNNPQYDPNQQF
ncbi:hypothetical protein DFQ26_009456 [Actinomortierella ambigua]|nr:hypothetical protein DFQ26_009456 [Actinomortierella ambigua]